MGLGGCKLSTAPAIRFITANLIGPCCGYDLAILALKAARKSREPTKVANCRRERSSHSVDKAFAGGLACCDAWRDRVGIIGRSFRAVNFPRDDGHFFFQDVGLSRQIHAHLFEWTANTVSTWHLSQTHAKLRLVAQARRHVAGQRAGWTLGCITKLHGRMLGDKC